MSIPEKCNGLIDGIQNEITYLIQQRNNVNEIRHFYNIGIISEKEANKKIDLLKDLI